MIYGVKVIHTHAVGEDERRYYEELILRVSAESFEDAYKKAGLYMRDCICEYQNPNGETVRTKSIEAVDCFLAYEPEGDVQELYSSFSMNGSSLSEDEYYKLIASTCTENDLRALRNVEFN